MKYLVAIVLSAFLMFNCTSEKAKCVKDHKKVSKMKKSGQLKNW